MIVWIALIGTLQTVHEVGNPKPYLGSSAINPSRLSDSGVSPANSGSIATAVHASILPSGPSGQLLPPGTLAPDKSYANSYARGQCTWYVASRRQIPPHWGNAVSWYFHASSSGWSVGTVPAVAAVAWTPAGSMGHVALVEQISADGKRILVSEMNYRGVGVKSTRWAAASQFKYIY